MRLREKGRRNRSATKTNSQCTLSLHRSRILETYVYVYIIDNKADIHACKKLLFYINNFRIEHSAVSFLFHCVCVYFCTAYTCLKYLVALVLNVLRFRCFLFSNVRIKLIDVVIRGDDLFSWRVKS